MAQTADADAATEFLNRPKAGFAAVQVDDAFGEVLEPSSGALSFRHVDVQLKGTGPDITLVRSSGRDVDPYGVEFKSEFGDWSLSIPRVETLADAMQGATWETYNPADPTDHYSRCTNFDRPTYKGGLDDPDEAWAGMWLVGSDGSRQEVLALDPSLPTVVTDFGKSHAQTQRRWQLACLPTTSNGQPGEGFLALTPDGLRYHFDRLLYFGASRVAHMDPSTGTVLRQRRTFARMYVSRIEDRFGNYVSYDYDSDRKLTSISASDGRRVELKWRADARLVDGIDVVLPDGTRRHWQYDYSDITAFNATLAKVTLPDMRSWTLTKVGQSEFDQTAASYSLRQCGTRSLASGSPFLWTQITNPSGLTARYTGQSIWHTNSYVPSGCRSPNQGEPWFEAYEEIPPVHGLVSVVRKEISGPGVSPLVWTFDYVNPAGTTIFDPCAAAGNCADTKTVTAHYPNGLVTRSVYSTRWDERDGLLLSEQSEDASGVVKRTRSRSYEPGASWPVGRTLLDWHSNGGKSGSVAPLHSTTTVQDGVTFQTGYSEFTPYAQPQLITESNSLGKSKTERRAYLNAMGPWLLGLPVSATSVDTGKVVSRTEYDARYLPWKTYAFGNPTPASTKTYYTDGNLQSVADGRGLTTTLSQWKRGVPQRIDYADGTSISADVSDLGLIKSITDQAGSKTCYTFDSADRLETVTLPSESAAGVCDTSKWAMTRYAYDLVAGDEYGIPAGHWRITETTGNRRKLTYFDALLRPIVEEVADTSNIAGTNSWVATRYDASGQVAFTSYPRNPFVSGAVTWSAVDTGIATSRDVLGRVAGVTQTSELGPLTTTTEYLTGLRTKVTNPRNESTITSYEAYGEPAYDAPAVITQPLGVKTQITRDVLGNTRQITRSGQ
jgi:YD repeat-containing protein